MKAALIAFFFFIVVALASGTVKMPTGDDITLLIASFSLLIIALFKKRDKAVPDEKKRN